MGRLKIKQGQVRPEILKLHELIIKNENHESAKTQKEINKINNIIRKKYYNMEEINKMSEEQNLRAEGDVQNTPSPISEQPKEVVEQMEVAEEPEEVDVSTLSLKDQLRMKRVQYNEVRNEYKFMQEKLQDNVNKKKAMRLEMEALQKQIKGE